MSDANTFGTADTRAVLLDPRRERALRRRFRRDDVPELALANSVHVPAGRWPVRGWLLLRRRDYDRIDPYATDLSLSLEDFLRRTPPVTLSGLTVVQARCVSTGLASDPDAAYLVEVTDARGTLWNRWSAQGTTSQYNVRAPAYPGEFYEATLDAGVPWTWDRLCQDLWSQMPALGSYPGLPLTPLGVPEGWSFPGEPAWLALDRVLTFCGLSVACDLTVSSPYAVVADGAADTIFDAATAQYADFLEDDDEWIDAGSGRVPGSVVCYFHRRNEQYGTEETVRRDALQWQTTPLYSVTVNSPAPYSASTAVHHLWGSFTVRYDVDGQPLAADVAQAAVEAQEMVTEYFRVVYSGTAGYMRRKYLGTVPFVTGSQVDGVCYRMDFRTRAGWETEIVRRPGPPWPEVTW